MTMRLRLNRRRFLKTSLVAWPAMASLVGRAELLPRLGNVKLGIITDELSQDLEEALRFHADYGLRYCELRQIWNKNLMNLSDEELARAKKLLDQFQVRVSNLASPIYKYNLPEMPARENEQRDAFRADFTEDDTEELLKRAFEIASFFGTNKIRIFSYWRVDDPRKAYPFVRDRLARGAELAGKNGMVLVLENEHTCNVGTGEELGRILREVNSAHLRATWDPGNAAMLGETPYPDGYGAVRGLLSHMHVKDLKIDAESKRFVWTPVGKGLIDYRGQFKSLFEDGYDETISLETHYRRPDGDSIESTRESLNGLVEILQQVM